MNYQEYQQLFEDILQSEQPQPPYDDPDYRHYTKLNQARMKRRDKQLNQNDALTEAIINIKEKQHWIIITEPWCGDAAHTLPLIIGLAGLNENITYDIQLRDSPPFLIDSYLTGTSKSIPKLIVRDSNGKDLFNWGPRPQPAQLIADELRTALADHAVIASALQEWYNQDDNKTFNEEMLVLFNSR